MSDGSETDVIAGLTPRQREAARQDGAVLVLAGAGTGKTRTLTAAVARRVRVVGAAPSRILAVTFTNKAAAEMSARIRTALTGQAGPTWVGTRSRTRSRCCASRPAPMIANPTRRCAA